MAASCLSAQVKSDSGPEYHFNGAVNATNNGISLIPTFSLGKPATIIELNAGGERLTFEPQFRFSLEGQPWSFIFWWRYKLINTNKLRMGTGLHPAIVFRETPIIRNGQELKGFVAQRYLAGELNLAYYPAKNIGFGPYILYSRGLETGVVKNNLFLALNVYLTNIRLGGQYFMKLFPQIYYLGMDDKSGLYASATVFFVKQGFPLSVSLIGNRKIKSAIVSKEFVWNISLVYNFGNKLVKKR
ncbi:MAG: hypothetical protein ACK5FV_13460 [Bacteroidota bacterium]|nr:hypothetical protein [Saprospiraceae bacterium]